MKHFLTSCIFFLISVSFAFGITLDTDSPKEIVADKIEFNPKTGSIKTVGAASISLEGGQRMTLYDAYMDEKGRFAGGRNADLTLSHRTHISADVLEKDDTITNASGIVYTACHNCDENINAWEISASRLRHDVEAQYIEFYNPIFWIYDIPIFWFPYLNYPDPTVRHKSGFLIPDMNTTNDMGSQLNLPFYIAFSDTHDATITASYLTSENLLWQAEHQLNARRSSFRTKGSYTNNKSGDTRWHIFNDDLVELGDHARINMFLQRTSDQTYLQKYGFYDDQPYLDSGARAEVFGEYGYVASEIHVFQELRASAGNKSNPSGDILPNIHGVYQTAPLFGDTYASLMGDFIGISNMENGASIQRMLGQASVTSPWTVWGGSRITLSASARYDAYNFNNTIMLDGAGFSGTETRFLPSGYAEWALPLVNNRNDWTHVLTPQVRMTVMRRLETPAFANIDSSGTLLSDATLFANKRYSGYDLWENGEFMDYGLGWSSFYDGGISVSGFAGQTFDFSQSNDLDPNSGFHNGASDLVGRLGVEYKDWFSINNRIRVSNNTLSPRHFESVARTGTRRNYLESGYMYAVQLEDANTIANRTNEIVAGFGIGITGRFLLHARTTYNITEDKIQKQNAGIYYDHPCYMVGFEYQKDGAIRYNQDTDETYIGRTTFKLQFSLKLTEGKQGNLE
ncbi:MAG: LPS assembly protein LptD [Alphaproteobacteria bacterium]|nr:LPS assembly protein LptD [Alphaproteobacteria bacterium]